MENYDTNMNKTIGTHGNTTNTNKYEQLRNNYGQKLKVQHHTDKYGQIRNKT